MQSLIDRISSGIQYARFAVAGVLLLAAAAQEVSAGGNPSVSGHANLTIGGELRTFSFTAVQHEDGTVTGQAELFNRIFDSRFHIAIDCLRIIGNLAVLSGVVAQVVSDCTGPDCIAVGDAAIFAVRDNGEGNSTTADEMTGVAFPFSFPVPTFCMVVLPPPQAFGSIEAGNIQVRP
jgi:hypothetical protein